MYLIKDENYNGIMNALGELKVKEAYSITKTLLECEKMEESAEDKEYKTFGLYDEGKPSPRIEFRVLIGDKDITKKIDTLEDPNLHNFLKSIKIEKKPIKTKKK